MMFFSCRWLDCGKFGWKIDWLSEWVEFSWSAQFVALILTKVTHFWLKLLSFEVDRGNFGCYAPPCDQEHWLKRWHFMEAAGDRWWSFAGGVYVLRAVKRVRGMRLILPGWSKNKAPRKALTTVTHKEIGSREQWIDNPNLYRRWLPRQPWARRLGGCTTGGIGGKGALGRRSEHNQ